ncbi:hypothetical protein [Burkholderia sp. LMG 32019]|uniref:hypothetical protein n=1 Tax=Burkholderia sp. LMG 32019 TaxID=3158173 RepID=UPI003C2AD91F
MASLWASRSPSPSIRPRLSTQAISTNRPWSTDWPSVRRIGSFNDYLFRTCQGLRSNGLRDAALEHLASLVRIAHEDDGAAGSRLPVYRGSATQLALSSVAPIRSAGGDAITGLNLVQAFELYEGVERLPFKDQFLCEFRREKSPFLLILRGNTRGKDDRAIDLHGS